MCRRPKTAEPVDTTTGELVRMAREDNWEPCLRCGEPDIGLIIMGERGRIWLNGYCPICSANLSAAARRRAELFNEYLRGDADHRRHLPFRAMRPDEREQPATTFTSRRGPDLVDLIGLGFRALRMAA